jgi:tRNA (guanine37-N1)-methyltransferase
VVPRYDVITLFPPMFEALSGFGVSGRAVERGLCRLGLWNPRDFAEGNYRQVDDRPYGGGPGMVMMVEPLERAVHAAMSAQRAAGVGSSKLIHLTPQGRTLTQGAVQELAAEPGLILLAGRYEGVDERLFALHSMEDISVGDYVLSGGELAAMTLLDAVIRLLPGALGDEQSAAQDSFADGLLDCPHYTRPDVYEGLAVPPVLLSGRHADIRLWRLKQALGRTWQRRPELLEGRSLSKEEAALLEEFKQESRI